MRKVKASAALFAALTLSSVGVIGTAWSATQDEQIEVTHSTIMRVAEDGRTCIDGGFEFGEEYCMKLDWLAKPDQLRVGKGFDLQLPPQYEFLRLDPVDFSVGLTASGGVKSLVPVGKCRLRAATVRTLPGVECQFDDRIDSVRQRGNISLEGSVTLRVKDFGTPDGAYPYYFQGEVTYLNAKNLEQAEAGQNETGVTNYIHNWRPTVEGESVHFDAEFSTRYFNSAISDKVTRPIPQVVSFPLYAGLGLRFTETSLVRLSYKCHQSRQALDGRCGQDDEEPVGGIEGVAKFDITRQISKDGHEMWITIAPRAGQDWAADSTYRLLVGAQITSLQEAQGKNVKYYIGAGNPFFGRAAADARLFSDRPVLAAGYGTFISPYYLSGFWSEHNQDQAPVMSGTVHWELPEGKTASDYPGWNPPANPFNIEVRPGESYMYAPNDKPFPDGAIVRIEFEPKSAPVVDGVYPDSSGGWAIYSGGVTEIEAEWGFVRGSSSFKLEVSKFLDVDQDGIKDEGEGAPHGEFPLFLGVSRGEEYALDYEGLPIIDEPSSNHVFLKRFDASQDLRLHFANGNGYKIGSASIRGERLTIDENMVIVPGRLLQSGDVLVEFGVVRELLEPNPAPSVSPSVKPSVSVAPSVKPSTSMEPSLMPSVAPTVGVVERVAGANRYGTSALVMGKGNWSDTVVLASGVNPADALAATPLAAALKAPVLLTHKGMLDAETLGALRSFRAKGGQNVVLAGGPGSISPAVEAQVKRIGFEVQRLAGADRFATASKLAFETKRVLGASGKQVESVFLVDGMSFPDALAVGPAAAANNGVILLTNGAKLPAGAAAEARGFNAKVYAVGGKASAAGRQLGVESISGQDRYQTAVLVAKKFVPGASRVVLASGKDFADALSGGALAANKNAVLLLSEPASVSAVVRSHLQEGSYRELYVAGGVNAISAKAFSALMALLAGK